MLSGENSMNQLYLLVLCQNTHGLLACNYFITYVKPRTKFQNLFCIYLVNQMSIMFFFPSIYSSLSLMFETLMTNVPPYQEMYAENCFVRLSLSIVLNQGIIYPFQFRTFSSVNVLCLYYYYFFIVSLNLYLLWIRLKPFILGQS